MATISRGLSQEFGRTAERAAGAHLAVSGKLQAASCKLQAASCKLQAASCKLQAANNVLACWAVNCFLKDFAAIARLKKKPRD